MRSGLMAKNSDSAFDVADKIGGIVELLNSFQA